MSDAEEHPPKTFTVDEANALLPAIAPLVQQLQALQRSIIETNQQMEVLARKLSSGNGFPIASIKTQLKELAKHQLQLVEAFQSALQQLEELGAILKDLNTGLVDFYALQGPEPIFLCWKLGEERVAFWHTLEDGAAGRQPLEG